MRNLINWTLNIALGATAFVLIFKWGYRLGVQDTLPAGTYWSEPNDVEPRARARAKKIGIPMPSDSEVGNKPHRYIHTAGDWLPRCAVCGHPIWWAIHQIAVERNKPQS